MATFVSGTILKKTVERVRDEISDIASGEQGADGVDGLSAFELAVQNGFEGTLAEWLDSLRGQDGVNAVSNINPRGEWESDAEYNQFDVVTWYNSETGTTNSYMAINSLAPAGTFPSDNNYFMLFVMQGPQGTQGEQGQDGNQGETGFSPYIDETYQWVDGDGPTGVDARGLQGEDGVSGYSPWIDPETGNWVVDGEVTTYPSRGANYEFNPEEWLPVDNPVANGTLSVSDIEIDTITPRDGTITIGKDAHFEFDDLVQIAATGDRVYIQGDEALIINGMDFTTRLDAIQSLAIGQLTQTIMIMSNDSFEDTVSESERVFPAIYFLISETGMYSYVSMEEGVVRVHPEVFANVENVIQGPPGPIGPQGVDGPVGEIGPQGEQGPQGPTALANIEFGGIWNEDVTYEPNTVVTHLISEPIGNIPVGTHSFASLVETQGVEPGSDDAVWAFFVAQGPQGVPGYTNIIHGTDALVHGVTPLPTGTLYIQVRS